MQIRKSGIRNLPTTILIVLGVLVWAYVATADMYTDSAHGNIDPGYGVNRSGTDYDIGDCAHCHETFEDSICGVNQLMLFYDPYINKCDLFCYRCHSDLFYAEQPVTNYPYCVTFGGGTAFYPNIRKQFCSSYSLYVNCGSKHNLWQIREVIKNDPDWGFSADPSPCVACHPPHAAQRNHPVEIDGEGKLNTAIRRPEHYKNTNPQYLLWGDDANERMSSYASSVGGTYQAPYYGSNPSSTYEPANNSTSDGSNLPDYVTFCMDCHVNQQDDPERGENVKAINWSNSIHGASPANNGDTCSYEGGEGSLKPPYTDDPNNYVLSCLDCHEPHGTDRRLHLIRRFINGQDTGADTGICDNEDDYVAICQTCHEVPHPNLGGCVATMCHGHESTVCAGSGSCQDKPCF